MIRDKWSWLSTMTNTVVRRANDGQRQGTVFGDYCAKGIPGAWRNHQTGFDLDLGPSTYRIIFKNRLDYFDIWEYQWFVSDGLVYNTLATSFSISLQLGNKRHQGRDVLVWQSLLDSLRAIYEIILGWEIPKDQEDADSANARPIIVLGSWPQDQHISTVPLGYVGERRYP